MGRDDVGVCRRASTPCTDVGSDSSSFWVMRAFWYAWRRIELSRWRTRVERVKPYVVAASRSESANAPRVKVSVMRDRRPRRRGRNRARKAPTLRLQAVAQPAHGHHVAWVGRIHLDLGAQAPDVYVDQAPVAEVPVAPHPVEQHLSAEDPTRVGRQLAQQSELGLGEVQLAPGEHDLALVRDDLEVAEGEVGVAGRGRPGPAQ